MADNPLGTSLGGASAGGSPLRRKKSLPKLFILSRKKSFKSRPSSPLQATGENCLPPNRVPLGASTKTLHSTITSYSSSTSTKKPVLKESSAGMEETEEFSPRNMAGAGLQCSSASSLDPGSNKQNTDHGLHDWSRIPEDQLVAWPLPKSNLPRNRSQRQLKHPTFDKVPPSEDLSTITMPPRPHTAVQARFKHNVRDESQHTPLHVGSARKANEENLLGRSSPTPEHWVGWKASYTRSAMRESIRSGLSSASSLPDSGSTEQSSIFTKMSSVSDITIDLDEVQLQKHGSMTVDDAIDLYSAGFDDDEFDLPEGDPMKSPSDEETRRWSSKIAEAMNDTIDSVLLRPPCLVNPETRQSCDSAAIMSGEVFRSIFPRPPPLRSPSATHDQYGFRKWSREISIERYDAWYTGYANIQERRSKKWVTFMQDQGLASKEPTRFPQRSAKVLRFIRKGLPPAWRGNAWFFYAGGDAYLRMHPDLYAELVLKSQTPKLSVNDKDSIERDLHRTFPDNLHFKPEEPQSPTTETPLLSSLRRVLCAFAIHHPRTGYCQSLNFIAGLLLLFLPEEKAFWMLHIITTKYLPGTHEVSLEGANVDLWVLMLALKEAVPNIWAKVGGEVNNNTTKLPPISLCTTSWFMSIFIGTLPIESVLRVWDVLFYEGSRTLFRVALSIFKLGEDEIKSVSDPMEIFQVVQGLPRKMLGVTALMGVACRRGGVSQAWIEKKRRERREWYASQRAVEKTRKDSRDVGRRESQARKGSKDDSNLEALKEPPAKVATSRSRAYTGWRGRIGLGGRG